MKRPDPKKYFKIENYVRDIEKYAVQLEARNAELLDSLIHVRKEAIKNAMKKAV